MSSAEPTPRPSPPAWLWGAGAALVAAAVVVLLATDKAREPGEAFRYDVNALAKVDQASVMATEAAELPIPVARASALATAPDGRLFVAGEGAVVVLDKDGKESARFAVPARPTAIAYATAKAVLLVGFQDHVEVFGPDGKGMAQWPGLGLRACVTSVVAGDNDVYAADAGNRIVVRYDYEGMELGRIGAADETRQIPGLTVPGPYLDMAFDPQGALWVVNPGRHALEQYRASGDLVSSWARSGTALDAFCGCCNPIHIAFWRDASLVTAEKGLNRVKVYAPDCTLRGVVLAAKDIETPERAAATGTDDAPVRDLAVDAQGRILVLDGRRNAVRVFEWREK